MERQMSDPIINQILNSLTTPHAFFGTDGMLLRNNHAWMILTEELSISSSILFFEDLVKAFGLPQATGNQQQHSSVVEYNGKTLRIIRHAIQTRNDNGILVEINDLSGSKKTHQQSERIISDAIWKIRSRIATIQNVFTLLVDYDNGSFNSETLGLLKSSRREAFELERQAENLRYLMQTDTGLVTFIPQLEELILRQCADTVLMQLEPLLGSFEPRPSITIAIDPCAKVITDRQILFKSLSTLICNSLIYNDRTLAVNISSVCDDNGCTLSVRDHGWGIAPDEQHRIFSYTFRGAKAKRSSYSGLGIELYLVRQLLLLVDSTIGFTSSEHDGTLFTIQFNR